MNQLDLLDIVAPLNPIPRNRLILVYSELPDIISLPKGHVGTIVEVYNQPEGIQYLVEFSDQTGCEYAMAVLKPEELLVLHYELTAT